MSRLNKKRKELETSNSMEPISGYAELNIPAPLLWKFFTQGSAWPLWNRCFFWVHNRQLKLGDNLIWMFQPIRAHYLYKMFASARIVELEENSKVTWEVTILPGFFARHTYFVEPISKTRCRYGSWEKAYGFSFRLLKKFWLSHFTFVCDLSVAGGKLLEEVYQEYGELTAERLKEYKRKPGVRLKHIGGTKGTPLLFIPGIDGCPGSVEPIMESLAKTRPVYLVDYQNENNNRFEELVEEIVKVIQEKGPATFDLCGQSIGSLLAAAVSAKLPNKTKHLVLTCTYTRVRNMIMGISNIFLRLTPVFLYKIITPLSMRFICGPVGDGKNHPFFKELEFGNKKAIMRRTAWQINRDFSQELSLVSVPMLVINGENDRFVPRRSQEFQTIRKIVAGKKQGELHAIPNAGHVLLSSAAIQEAVKKIEDFCCR